MTLLKEYQFSVLFPETLFFKFDSVEGRPFRKIKECIYSGGQAFNCYDDNTGELFFISPASIVYVPERI